MTDHYFDHCTSKMIEKKKEAKSNAVNVENGPSMNEQDCCAKGHSYKYLGHNLHCYERTGEGKNTPSSQK